MTPNTKSRERMLAVLNSQKPKRVGSTKADTLNPPELDARSISRVCKCLFQKKRSSACIQDSVRELLLIVMIVKFTHPLPQGSRVAGILDLQPARDVILAVRIVEWARVEMTFD